nr:ATP-binding protein [Candidatus Sigynarchaeota archaeon]
MQFIDRERELAFLESKYREPGAQLIVLYGRRRIGKTELISKFCEGKNNLYFLGRLESREDTIRRLNQITIEHFKDMTLLRQPFLKWEDFLDYMTKQDERLILVFDEFPFVVERFPDITSVLQDKWDNKLRHANIIVILSGSSISMMERHALDYKSPLYGRRTGQWKLDTMDVVHLKEFFPRYSMAEMLEVYGSIDTIPGYLTRFDPRLDVRENIREKILRKGEYLYDEVEILLREELRDPANYMTIMATIAGGSTKLHEIHDTCGLDKSLLSKYIHTLELLGVIERVQPVTASYKKNLKSKGAIHEIKDNFIDFWFRFVYTNKAELERGRTDAVMNGVAT